MKKRLNIESNWYLYRRTALQKNAKWTGVAVKMIGKKVPRLWSISFLNILFLEEVIEENVLLKPNKKASSSKPSVTTSKSSNPIKKCLYCGCKTTPMWRRGPQGAGTLCNACGVKWKHGKILNDCPPESPEKKRKTSMTGGKKTNNKKQANVEETNVMPWESTSSESSPLDSFSGSPNTSPSLITSVVEQSSKRKSLIPYDSKTLSVYVGEDAIEAAAVLTLLKKTK